MKPCINCLREDGTHVDGCLTVLVERRRQRECELGKIHLTHLNPRLGQHTVTAICGERVPPGRARQTQKDVTCVGCVAILVDAKRAVERTNPKVSPEVGDTKEEGSI